MGLTDVFVESVAQRGTRGEADYPDRLHRFFERSVDTRPHAVALVCESQHFTYADLDRRANRLARYLLGHGVQPGQRVGIFIERSLDLYVALLAAMKSSATFVPIDPSAPADRVVYIASDSELSVIITTSAAAPRCDGAAVTIIAVDTLAEQIAREPGERPSPAVDSANDPDPICYILYTSGSTGRPKGVLIAQSSICNFINIVPELYGVTPSDRVYQGMVAAFDFSFEEIWPTWAVGATLVAGPTDGRRVGVGLAQFLEDSAITMIYCVPTVLATLDRTIPSIRIVNVGGEACPAELVTRWGQHGRRILNTYGPTEATVTCTMAELSPGKPVTIGKPVPSYTITLLDDDLVPVADGQVGEICVGGPGVARGYVNRPDMTAQRFVSDPSGSGSRIYRTGDLGRVLPDGDIEYLGRADAEVKVRGHRVDLGEIEGVFAQDEAVAGAVVNLHQVHGAAEELVAYIVLVEPERAFEQGLAQRLHRRAQSRLPAYMVPAFLEWIDAIPMMPSGKADRKSLPDPRSGRLVGGTADHVAPQTDTERHLKQIWEDVLSLPAGKASVGANLFEDLGGHSLVAATLISRLRATEYAGTQTLSILDVYAHPTVRSLAEAIDERVLQQSVSGDHEAIASSLRHVTKTPAMWRVMTFGLTQLSWIYSVLFIFLLPLGIVYSIQDGVPSFAMAQQLLFTLPVSYIVGRWLLPVAAARVFTSGLREGTYPLWGLIHLRVWATQRVMTLSPIVALAGSPFAAGYLRLAGARIGEGCHIGTDQIPLPAFIELGDGATVGSSADMSAFTISDGELRLGRIVVGKEAAIAGNCVLQGPCEVGDGAVLREQSLLSAGDSIPAGQSWAGSPASSQAFAGDPVFDLMSVCDQAPRAWPRELLVWFGVGIAVLELLPLVALVPMIAVIWGALLAWGQVAALIATALGGPLFVVSSCALILFAHRFALIETPVGIHHLRSQLGLEKWFGDKLLLLSLTLNNSLYATLFTPYWLRALGAHVGKGAEVSTIANIDPDLLTLKDDCFVADMASIGSTTYCNGHVAFRETVVGARSFVGNASFIPSGTHLGDESLIGVLSVPPVDGVPRGTSWLGSPPFFLPRREVYEEFTEEQTFKPTKKQVRARFAIEFLRIVLPSSILATSTFGRLFALSYIAGPSTPMWLVVLATPLLALAFSLVVVLIAVAIKWAVIGRYRQRVEPLWSGFVRRTEFVTGIYETTAVPVLLATLAGTPMLGPLLRLFGARVGRRTLIDTTYLTEFDLVHIADDVTVGTNASLQTHLFEDRVMKMSTVSLDAGSSVGARAVVLYDAQLSTGATLAPLSLVMKGETLPTATDWTGIPAQHAPRTRATSSAGDLIRSSS